MRQCTQTYINKEVKDEGQIQRSNEKLDPDTFRTPNFLSKYL